ncbi:hypothetical protein [Mycobacterium phage SWU1]|uniref:Gene 82 protein n=2 Tax=Fromanvirus TaxID=186764 RepID=VG82_BPML5|nr:Hypothetical Protein PBI_L5_82 [Fromanvirus L5]YP_006383007.1 hypothetical protein A321_gp09 [Mycobacterium phage SWU1]Q05298.1 RecName: Full=Gene 82 protein; AltName: Full=Gp82 [Fromanvirus L5]AFI24997.1 hypothetical protein [Mycobacterium phage SWU1]CAA79458.1 Hypothetical Protein PBI_L5_82 [Fromanvirus L5]
MTPKPIRVFVYKNLHRTHREGKPWYSVQALEGDFKGRVIHRSGHVLLAHAKGVVRPAGRDKVRRERRKVVHAGIVGELISLLPQDFVGSKIAYNPYENDTFVHANTQAPFLGADRVYLSDSGVRAA